MSVQNGVYTVGGSIQTPVSTSHVYDMLIDYPNLNRVFSSIDECHTLSEQSALQLLQVCTLQNPCHLWHCSTSCHNAYAKVSGMCRYVGGSFWLSQARSRHY